MGLLLGNHTPEEREEYIQAHMAICHISSRGKRWNTKTSGPSLKGTMSVHAGKRKCASKKWKRKLKREAAKNG